MKKLLYMTALLLAAACSGTVDTDDTNLPEEYVGPYTLEADKTEVEASGADTVTFSLLDSYGRNILLDKVALQNVNISTEDGVRVKRMTAFSTYFKNGEYVYSATYKGEPSANKVTVVAKNRKKYETYFRKVGLFKCTSVWCSACPSLASTLHTMSDEAKEHSVVLACHGNFNSKDPFSLYVGTYDLGSYLMGVFGGGAWPTLIYDLNSAEVGAARQNEVEENILARRSESPATCGIKISSVKMEDGALKVKAAMKSSTGGKYDLACAVMRDGLKYQAQGSYSLNGDGVYDEVVVNLSENFVRYDSKSGKELKIDEEYTKEFVFPFTAPEGQEVKLPSEEELKSFRVAVYAHRAVGEKSTMDNIAVCGYGKSIDYLLNE